MSNCSLPSFGELRAAVKNRRWPTIFTGPSNQADILKVIDHVDSMFELKTQNVVPSDVGDDLRRYTVKDFLSGSFAEEFIRRRVTDRVAKKFRKYRTKTEVERLHNHPNQIKRREYGTVVHNVLQEILTALDREHKGGSKADFNAILNKYRSGTYPISNSMFVHLQRGAADVYKELLQVQNRIDPNGTMEIRTERVIADPVRDVAGTIDLLVIFSNGAGGIVDFKTFSPTEGIRVLSTGKKSLISDSYVTSSKREGWEMQTSEYKRILLSNYGVRDILFTRIAPVWLDFEWDAVKGELGALQDIQMGSSSSPYLRTKTVGTEKIGKQYVDEFLGTRYKEIRRLREKLKKAAAEDREGINQRIAKIYSAIENFTQDLNIDGLIDDAVIVAGKTYTTKEELRTAANYVKAVLDLENQMERDVDPVFEINTDLQSLKKAYAAMNAELQQMVLDDVGDRYGKIELRGGSIILSEDDFLTQFFGTSTESQNPFVRYAQDKYQESYNKQRRALETFDKKMHEVEVGVKEFLRRRGESLSDLHKYMINPKTGQFYDRLSDEFRDMQAKAREENNARFFMTHYSVKKTNKKGETYDAWRARARSEYERALRDRHTGETNVDDRVEKGLEWWDERFDMSLKPNGDPVNPKAWTRKNNGWLEMKPDSILRYESKEYRVIRENEPLLKYYNQMRAFVGEFREAVGYDMIHSPLFFPIVRANAMEKLQRSSLYALGQDIREMFSIRQDEEMFGDEQVEVEGEKRMPMYFTQPFLDADGKVDLAQQSLDIGASMRLFAKVAYNYQYMQEIEADILATQDVIKTVQYEKEGWGTNVFDFMNNIATKDKSEGDTMTERVFNTLKNYHLYGIRSEVFLDKRFTYVVSKLQNYFSLRTLGLAFVPATASYVSAQLSAKLEGTKGQIFTTEQYNKSTLNMAKEHRKYHALAFFFGVHNEDVVRDVVNSREGGIVRDNLYASNLNAYINDRTLMRPFSYGDERLDNHIANAMALNYGIDSDGNVRRLVNLPEGAKSLYERFTVDDKGNVKIEGLQADKVDRVVLQFQQAVRAGQRRIKGTMSQEDIAYYQTQLYGRLIMQFKSWMPGIIRERFGALKYNDILDAAEEGRYRVLWNENTVEGDMNMAMYLLATTKDMLLFLGKNLLTYGTVARSLGIGSIKMDENRARRQYQAFVKKYENHPTMRERFPTFEDFVEMKKGQIKAVLAEVEILIVLSAMLFALASDWDDDGEPLYSEMWITHKIYQILNRAKTEMSFTYSPLEYAKLFNSPVPLASLLTQAAKLLSNTLDETGDMLYGEEVSRFPVPFGANKGGKADRTEKLHYTFSLIPAAYQLRKFFDLLEMDASAVR